MNPKWTVIAMNRLSAEDVVILDQNIGQIEEYRYWHLEKHRFESNQDFVLDCLSQGYDLAEITDDEHRWYKENDIKNIWSA